MDETTIESIHAHTHTHMRCAAVLVCRKSHLSMPLVTECACYKFWICAPTETYKAQLFMRFSLVEVHNS